MLLLAKAFLDEIHEHILQEYPREACGILLGGGTIDEWKVEKVFRAKNLAPSIVHDRYLMDPRDRLRAEDLAKKNGLSIVGFYHSHPDHPVYFSETDLKNSEEFLMGEPWLSPSYGYLVLSVSQVGVQDAGAFVVDEGKSRQIQVKIA